MPGDGAFGRYLGSEEVTGVEPGLRDRSLREERRQGAVSPPCEGTGGLSPGAEARTLNVDAQPPERER